MVDLKSQYLNIKSEIDDAIQGVIDSSCFIKGSVVESFQHKLEAFLGVRHVIPVGNGTDAIRLSLMALGLKPGDEVITSTFTFVATAEVAASIGCVPVLVDVDADTFCMSPSAVEKAITNKTRAIVPVNLFGQNAQLETLKNIADKYGLFLVEDSCQSINSDYIFTTGESKKSGTIGVIGCTSFFPSKNLGCFGDGGAVFTDNDNLAEKVRSIANHGMTQRYHYDCVGLNSRLDAIQAAVLEVKLNHLNEYTNARQLAASKYDSQLQGVNNIICPVRTSYSTHVFHQYTIKVPKQIRDTLKSKLAERDIPTMVYYPIPLHMQNPYKDVRYQADDFINAEALSTQVLSLPMHTELTDDQISYICDNIKSIVNTL